MLTIKSASLNFKAPKLGALLKQDFVMKKHPTFDELLKAQREGRNKVRQKVKPVSLPADPDERDRVIREAVRHVIEKHREELENLANK